MALPAFDPRQLDVAAFAVAQSHLSGEWPLAALHRLGSQNPESVDASVTWAVRGERREPAPGAAQIWLHLRARTTLELVCQRCLQAVRQDLDARRSFRFVKDEAEAERLDEHSEDDVLALNHALDLQALVEDELILALPLIPRHEVCPQPLLLPGSPLLDAPGEDHAFAALAQWRRRAGDGGHDH